MLKSAENISLCVEAGASELPHYNRW